MRTRGRRRVLRALVGASVVTVIAVGVPILLAEESVTSVDAAVVVPAPNSEQAVVPSTSPLVEAASVATAPSRSFDRARLSTTDPTSPWVIVNKSHPISPSTFVPEVRVVAAKEVGATIAGPLRDLLDAAAEAGSPLVVVSGFRTYGHQHHVYQNQVASTGSVEAADEVSARPGHSEHQSGLAVDVDDATSSSCQLQRCFGDTEAGRWVAEHADEFGFLVRYTAENSATTGYAAEPWHLRYIGRPLVHAMQSAGVSTLEEFFGVTGGDYPGR